ncbi:AMP-binding protein [Akkermansiaceae bacterium]|nr:AMP-binding protein [Akkermansiaceae bacterium]
MNVKAVRSARFWEDEGCYPDGVPFHTSGSTGQPRCIVLPKEALLLSARAVNEWLGAGADAVWGLALPIDHVGGFGVVARAHAAGCGFSRYQGKWDARKCAGWLRESCVTHLSLVPTQLHDLLGAGMEAAPSLRAVVVGGGRLPDEMGQAARDAGWPVLASYGMTETCSQVATQALDSLGLPFAEAPLQLLPIWDAELSDAGLLRLRGDALFSGTITDGGFRRREGDWFTTNDRVELSARTVRPLGRSDSLVKVMGELVDLDGIEARLGRLCGERGKSVAVIAVPDTRKEHALIAVFEGEALPSAVDDYNRQAPGPERISRCHVVTGFPRSDMGKLLRASLAGMCGQ